MMTMYSADWQMDNYKKKVQQAIQAGAFKRGEIYDIDVRHDDWCGVWVGKPCNCDPDITIGPAHVRGDS